MGNCQAAEAATVVIQHPEGKVERAYWSLSASQVMAANPGHYVAAVIVTTPSSSTNSNNNSRNAVNGGKSNSGNRKAANPVKHLKLLRPDDTLHIGHVYRLVSFEEVLREFASKKHVKLSRLLAKKVDHKPTRSPRRTSSSVGSSASARGRITTTFSASEEKPKPKPKPNQKQQPEQEKGRAEVEEEAASAARVEAELEEAMQRLMAVGGGSSGRSSRAPYRHHAQWRPALQSIAEAGTTAT